MADLKIVGTASLEMASYWIVFEVLTNAANYTQGARKERLKRFLKDEIGVNVSVALGIS